MVEALWGSLKRELQPIEMEMLKWNRFSLASVSES